MNTSLAKRMNIFVIAIPLLAENMLRFLFSFTDMFMLSGLSVNGVRFGDDAVAAVGLVMNFTFFINILYLMINSGAGIVITQYNGAGKAKKATQTVVTSVFLAALVGVVISIVMFFLTKPIISVYRLSPVRTGFAEDYLLIFGSLSLGLAMNTVFSTVLRSYGYSKEPMFINIAANAVNVFGNYCFIYGALGFPQWGVAGVALSTVISQFLAAASMLLIILKKKDIALPFRRFFKIKFRSIREILRFGLPNGGESLSYNIAMIVMNYFVAQMDFGLPPDQQINLPAYNYAFIFARFILYFAYSAGQGTQIITGYLVGAGRKDEAYRKVFKYFYFSFVWALILAGTLSLFRKSILSIFPMDENIFTLCSSLVVFTLLLEPGRTFNLIIINGLKGSGDVDFPVKMGIISMWGIGVVSAFVLGVVLNLGVIGIWIAIAMDEWTRGIIMYFRWKSKVWQSKSIIRAQNAAY
jgi:putative MATE family efflux protein